jgi:hypothetical protein
MNDAQVRAVPNMNGWEGHFRKVHKAGWHPVEINGIAQLYETEEKAKIAAYEALHRHIFGDGILGTGEKASIAKAEAEFAKVFPGRGRKPFTVERR